MLVGLLAPPDGPDLAFTKEVLDAAAWTSLTLLIGVTVRQRGGWLGLVVLGPLLLSAGAWIQLQSTSPALVQLLAPGGLPAPGLRAALASTYWPEIVWPWPFPEPHAAPPNIWFLRFTLAYALALTVLERVTEATGPLRWRATFILAALVGFLGLVEEALALTILCLWASVEAVRFLRGRPHRVRIMARATAGVGAAALVLAFGGGVLTGAAGDNLTLGLTADAARIRPLALADARPGGLAVLGLGPAIVAGAAGLLAPRQRLVIALAAASGVFLLAALTLEYESAPQNVARLDAHAGNFALFGLLAAIATRLREVRMRWRYPICLLLGAVVIWPSIALPLRTLAFQVSHGIELANAELGPAPRDIAQLRAGIGRQTIEQLAPSQVTRYLPTPPPPLHVRPSGALAPDQVTRYIHDRTPADARIFSPHPSELTLATGRPNAAGFAGYLHYVERLGPEYKDAYRYLEPSAFRRLGFEYLHATDAWARSLPDRSRTWLSDARFFEPLVREGQHALYRIQPAFLRLDPPPAPQSFEALRQAVPISANVYLTAGLERLNKLRLASVLEHAQLSGAITTARLHLSPNIPIKPPDRNQPDVVIVARDLSLGLAEHKHPTIWWDSNAIAYLTSESIAPAISPPPPAAPGLAVRLSNVRSEAKYVTFTAAFTDHTPEGWTGQDWLVLQLEDAPLAQPIHYEDDGYTLIGTQWFAGQIGPSGRTETYRYMFDALAGSLAVRNPAGDFVPALGTGEGLTPGVWTLAVRLQRDYLQTAVIPVLRIEVFESGQVAYRAYPGERGAALNPCPERMQQTDACRELSAQAATESSS